MPLRSLRTLLNNRRAASGRLAAQGRRLSHIDRLLFEQLPPPLHEQVKAAAVYPEQGLVVLAVPSSAWLARARFQEPQIRRLLQRQSRLQVARIRFRVVPPAAPPVSRRPPPTLSPAASELLESTAAGLSSDDPANARLAAALRRLARRGRSLS